VDRIGKNQIYQIIAGTILISIGIYLILSRVDFIVSSSVFLAGLVILNSGIRYRERLNMKKLEGEERKMYLRSAPFIIMLIGTIVLFVGLGGSLLASNLLHAGIVAFWFLGILFIGMLLVFAGAIVKAADKK
jgi:hypothetical protein